MVNQQEPSQKRVHNRDVEEPRELSEKILQVEGARIDSSSKIRTFRLQRRAEHGAHRSSDSFAELALDDPEAKENQVRQGYAKISQSGEALSSVFASSCMYVVLVNARKRVIGLAHVSTSISIKEFLEEWKKVSPADETQAYLVKGNGLSESQSSTDIISHNRGLLKDAGFKILEDLDQPATQAERQVHFQRGKNSSHIKVTPDGRVTLIRFEFGDPNSSPEEKSRQKIIEYELTPTGADEKTFKKLDKPKLP